MKEHFNFDSISNQNKWVETHNTQGKTNKTNKPDIQGEIKEDSLLNAADDLFDSEIKSHNRFDDGLIEGMDFEEALNQLNFINEQAAKPEGRRMMSSAHHSISPQQVMQLFA
jgi:hypothetical protein